MAKTKPYRGPLTPELTGEILSIPLPETHDAGPAPTTIGENLSRAQAQLQDAQTQLQDAVSLANSALDSNQMVGIVAQSVAKALKKRGEAKIVVEPNGSVVLVVGYPTTRAPPQPQPSLVVRRKWTSRLPPLAQLRTEAEQMGVDISDLGRQRRAIHERLQEAQERLSKKAQGPSNGPGHVPEGDSPTPPPEVTKKAPSQ